MKTTLAPLLLPLSFLAAFAADSPQALKESTIVEAVNEVDVLSGPNLDAKPAEEGEVFKAPDFLQTGRGSKARLEAEDGTVTRVGPNTLFSFQESDRTINLKRGSLLFHSPEGRGGGRVVTASATASVVGTTVIVEATEDGGFKVFVLEGEARVTFPDNTTRLLNAGQMTFVQPASPGAPAGETRAGTVLDFDLEAFVEGSELVNGFDAPLPSLPLIDAAIGDQNRAIENGTLRRAGAFILLSEDDDAIDLDLDALNQLFETQEEAAPPGFDPMVLVGAISASVQLADVEFANLPSGKVLRIGENGVEILDPEEAGEIPADIPRFAAGSIELLPDDQQRGLAAKLESAFDRVLISYDDGLVSDDDAITIAKFLLTTNLPFDERFVNRLEERFGPLVGDPNQGQRTPDQGSVQVTDPIDLTDDYFAP